MPPRHGPRRRPRSRDGRDVHGGHRGGEPRRALHPRPATATASRPSRTSSSATTSPPSTTPPTPTSRRSPGTTRASRTCGARAHRPCPRGTPPSRPDHGRRRPARPRPGEAFAEDDVVAATRDVWDVASPPGDTAVTRRVRPRAARRGLDGRRRGGVGSTGRGGGQRRRDGERRRAGTFAGRAARLLLDRLRLRRAEDDAVRRVRRPEPALGVRAHEAARRGGRRRGRMDRAQLLALRADRTQLRADDARRSRRIGTRSRSSTTSVELRRTSRTLRRRCASSSTRARSPVSGTSPRTATARGPTSRRRSSRRPG